MNHVNALLVLVCVLTLGACSNNGNTDQAAAETTASAQNAAAEAAAGRVFIISPADGAVVTSPFTVKFGIEGYSVAKAGTFEPDTGHHHLLIDTGLPPLDQPVPADEHHIHFGKGQTETALELAPGKHTLQLLLGDGNHIPHQPPLTSDIITITVSE